MSNHTNIVSNQKLISILQSRIAKRRKKISCEWFIYSYEGCEYDFDMYDRIGAKEDGNRLGIEQKQDKQIMKALIIAERKYKYHANTCHRLTQEVLKLRRQIASYKLTGKPYISGNAN